MKKIKLTESQYAELKKGVVNENMELDELMSYNDYANNEQFQVLRDALNKGKVVSVAFVKKDGTPRAGVFRKTIGAYQYSTRPKSDAQLNVKENHGLMNAIDVNAYKKALAETGDPALASKGSWRYVTLANVIGFLASGQFIDMREENEIMERFGEEAYNFLTKNMESAMNRAQQQAENDPEVVGNEPEQQEQPLDEGSWNKIMKGVRSGGSGPWDIVVIENNKVIDQKIGIKIQDMIPAEYEDLKRKYPNSRIRIEDATGMIVWEGQASLNEEEPLNEWSLEGRDEESLGANEFETAFKWVNHFGGGQLMRKNNINNGFDLLRALKNGMLSIEDLDAVTDGPHGQAGDTPFSQTELAKQIILPYVQNYKNELPLDEEDEAMSAHQKSRAKTDEALRTLGFGYHGGLESKGVGKAGNKRDLYESIEEIKKWNKILRN